LRRGLRPPRRRRRRLDLEKAKALPPLPGKPAPGQNRKGPTYSDGKLELLDAAE
jgi:catalase